MKLSYLSNFTIIESMNSRPQKIRITNDIDQYPAPYCYRYQIEIQLKDQIELSVSIAYYDREDLSIEEIEAEGFSEDDDFKWKGKWPEYWREPISVVLSKLKKGKGSQNLKVFMHEDGDYREYFPADFGWFEYFMQELIQAIYEKSGRQNEFVIQVLDKNTQESRKLEFTFSFYKRKVFVNENEISWNDSSSIMDELFSFEYDAFSALSKEPVENGFYINPGDGLWYQTDVAVKNNSKKSMIPLLESLFKKYNQS